MTTPPYFVFIATASKAGPVDIPIGKEYEFNLRYDIDPNAPLGCVRLFIDSDFEDPGEDAAIWDENDGIWPIDLLILPSTGTPGRTWAKFKAALSCKKQLNSFEARSILNCRKTFREAVNDSRTPQAPRPLYFTETNRTKRPLYMKTLLSQAAAGDISAILELGYREPAQAKHALRRIAAVPDEDSFIAKIGTQTWRCPDEAAAIRARRVPISPALRQALGRLGDRDALAEITSDVRSSEPMRFQSGLAAMVYIGGSSAKRLLAEEMLRARGPSPEPSTQREIELMRALETIEPSLNPGPELSILERVTRCEDWARKTIR